MRIKSSLIFKILHFFKKNAINLIYDFHIEAVLKQRYIINSSHFSCYFHYPFWICVMTLGKYYSQEGKAIKHL